jgi:hypothetical protein
MRLTSAALCGATLTLTAATHAARIERPVPDVSFEITAPSPRGPWTLRILNEDDRPVRIPADMRLLRLSITPPGATKPIACRLPRPLRPATFPTQRELYLAPGQAWIERFDPRLFCFGARETDALVEDASVRAWFGWGPDPYAVEGLHWPPETASLREIAAPKVLIGPGSTDETTMQAQPGGSSPATSAHGETRTEVLSELDEKAPRLALESPRFVQAARPHDLVLRVVARNVGHRPMRVVLRQRMLAFDIDGPGGPHRCEAERGPRATPPSLFRTLAPGAAVPLAVRLDEACANEAFRRPGLYRVIASLHVDEGGHAAYTGFAIAPQATLVRLLSAGEPFYETKPEATTLR